MSSQEQFNRNLCAFLSRATTPFHAVSAMAEQLETAGFNLLADGLREISLRD